jgi:hypothetical protein
MAVMLSALRARRPLPPGRFLMLISDTRAIVRLEGLGKFKKSNDLLGNRIRNLSVCSTLPQPLRYRMPHISAVYVKNFRFIRLCSKVLLAVCLYEIKTYFLTFIMVAFDTGTNFPAVSVISLFAILMMKLTQRMNGKGVPTQSQPQAAPLTLSTCNVAIQVHKEKYSEEFNN